MNSRLLLCCLVFCSACWETVRPHMLMEELNSSNLTTTTRVQNQTHSPSVLIVELSKSSKKTKKSEEKPQKTKLAGQVKRPPPPPNCTPLWGSCKSPNSVCCEHCAFCSCRLLRTVCYCRMGYPRC
ncbi:agouti signaling protein 1 [Pygocentrus nattereri]|uniref:Agouti-signaling protein n=1 Tax=Pygocentrus nattereri TaxID=42514 RepID=A0AAR2KMS3_PYGNA|nr:agouti signaling protein 1 [Pygocentrus nattereri]